MQEQLAYQDYIFLKNAMNQFGTIPRDSGKLLGEIAIMFVVLQDGERLPCLSNVPPCSDDIRFIVRRLSPHDPSSPGGPGRELL